MTKLGGGAEVSTTTGEAVTVGAAAAATAEEETATAMPAVTLTGTADADSGVTVTVEAPEGAFADGVTMTVETLTGDDAEVFLEAVAEQDFAQYDETYTVIDAVILDITFYIDGTEVQPTQDVTVTISGLDLATEADGVEADYALIYHMDDEGVVEYVEAEEGEEVGLDSYTFTASDFSDYGIVNVNVEYGMSLTSVSSNQGNAGHIDIGVSASASVTIGSTTYSNSSIGISSTDFTSGNVTITATQGTTTLVGSSDSSDWRRTGNSGNYTYSITDSSVDFVYNLSDLSSSSGNSGITQVRIGGCFPVGTKTNPVEYTMTLTKSVTLYAETGTDSQGNTVYDTSNYITVTVTLTATFGYWDSDNDCPGLSSGWSNGSFSSGSGLDFVLSVSSTTRPMVTVNKVVVDESGNRLTEASGVSFGYSITSTNNNVSTTETGSVTVGSSGVGVATTDVTNSSNYTVTETSYPDTIGDYTFIKSEVTYDGSTATITNVYGVSKTSVTVTKTWDDGNYVGRPSSITVNLMNGTTVAGTATLTADNNWTYTFTDLPVKDSGGNTIAYTVTEDTVDGYTSTVDGYTITNTLDTGSLTLNKIVKADSTIDTSAYTFIFYVSGFADGVTSVTDISGNTWSVNNGVATVTVPADGSVTLVDLPVGRYTVYEEDTDGIVTANGHNWSVSDNDQSVSVTKGGTASATITNTLTGDAVVSITKNWDDSSNYWNTRPTNDGSTFAVTLTATGTNGESYTYTTTQTWVEGTNVWTLDLSGVTAYDTEGNMLSYTIKESEVEGYTLTTDSDTTVTPANNTNVTLTNELQTADVTVTKIVTDSTGKELTTSDNNDDFRFALYDADQNSYGTVTLGAGGSYTFEDIPLGTYYLTEYLVGSHVHSYDTTVTVDGTSANVTETFNSTEQIKYHTVSFELTKDDSGKTVAVVVTNQEEEISVNLATLVNGTKTLTGDNVTDKTFTFTVKEASIIDGVETEGGTVATGTVTVSTDDTDKAITWTVLDESAFTYTEVGTYYYVIYEDVATGTGSGGVVYDATRYTLTIEVTKDENGGGLIATASMTKNVQNDDGSRTTSSVTSDTSRTTSFTAASTADGFEASDSFTASFTNTYDVKETSIILRATKVLEGRALKEGEFTIVIQQIDENGNNIGTAVERTNGATGAFGYEITYTEKGTYYYKVSEVKGDLKGVTYDEHYYIVCVDVNDENGVLTAYTYTAVGYYNADGTPVTGHSYTFDSMVFTNTYKASGTGSLSTYKVMQGRDFNAGETFTFLIEAMDSGAPSLTAPSNDVDFTDNGDGTYTVTVTVPDDVENGTTILKEVLASINVNQDDVGEWVYRVTETSASNTNGMTLDTATYGHLITVYVTDNGDGTMTVIPESTNDTDWNDDGTTDTTSSVIVNTFSPGIKTIYGTKSWVDGGASHDNESEVELTLYYRYLIPAQETESGEDEYSEWAEYTGDYIVTWGTANTSGWHIAGLPVYNKDGYKLYYKVIETDINNDNSYVITYGTDGSSDPETIPEDNAADNRYTITNTIKPEEVSISGTKTWVEPSVTNHVNADELVLTVSRNSDSTSLIELTLEDGNGTDADDTYIVVWDGDTYNVYSYYNETTGKYVGLPLYDASGYTYSYSVTESYANAYEETYADYTVETDWELVSDTEVTFDFTNRAPNDAEEDPIKTESAIVDGETSTNITPVGTLDGVTIDVQATLTSSDTVIYNDVAVGDEITYSISYYNNANDTATITITDTLDSGLNYVSSYPEGTYNSSTNTVTWTIDSVSAFTGGSVTVTVEVNNEARSITSGETAATVDNQATVYNSETEHTSTTNAVTNPLDDDEDESTEKGIISVTYEDKEGNEYTRIDQDGNSNYYVYEGDEIHYIISRYNNTNETVTFVIVDTLDEGVTYTYSSYGSTYYANVTTVTVDGNVYSIPAHSVVWIVTTNPYSYATVQMTVTVNSNAKTSTQTYNAMVPGTYDDESAEVYNSYKYGTGDNTTASVANQAVAYTVRNGIVSYSNVIENPLHPGEEQEPSKTISANSPSGYTEETVTEGTTVTYASVGVGSIIEYVIHYYNENNTPATITITDELEDGLTFVSVSDSGTVANESEDTNGSKYGGTVTWTLNVEPLTEGEVILVVQVNENAKTTEGGEDATVENTAVVNDYSTETVVNPIDPDDPGDPEKVVSAESEAGVNGANVAVGDQITYTISYYNHTNTSATVTIVDELDFGVNFVSATESMEDGISYTYDESSHTVTWTIDSVSAFTGGTVDLTVKVNSSAETQVENDANVTVGENEATTNLVTTPVDDEPEDPVKTVDTDGDEDFEDNGATVSVGDEITYTISYYNYYAVEADITITDQLDSGVEFVSATDQNGNTLTAENVFADEEDTYVKWPTFTAEAYERGTVTLTVRVTEAAKTADSSGDATVDNQAGVTIAKNYYTTNIVTNPLTPDEPEKPVKTVDVGTNESVKVGDKLTYTIEYYNNLSTAATVVIEDALDEGVDFVEASDGGVYDETTHTVTWTIENVSAFTEDSVTLTVTVNEKAKTADDSGNASVVNDADVTVGNQAKQTTDPVENPLDPDDPTKPEKTVDVGADTKVSVGDTLVYTISYYNNLSTAATVVIEDTLDEGVDFVKASNGGVYDETTHTVTWTIANVSAFTEGNVTLTVEVSADAQTANNNGTASVVNDADVTVGNQAKQTTDPVENPLDPDDPEDPVKTVNVGNGNAVGIGELITYTIKYYNYNNTAATVTITDVLEDGFTWVSGGTLGVDGKTVTWTIDNVAPYSYGTVTVTAQVNSNAKTVDNGDTSAAVENTASVTVGNDAAVNTNTVTNPIDPDDPGTPTKAISETSPAGANGESVEVGDEITYVISYYNHNNAATTVTITDALDENVTFVSAANEKGYTLPTSAYSEADHTVTWTIEAAAYETGTVTVTVKVADSAAGGKVSNTASVKIGNNAAVSTNTVTSEVEEVPATPSPTPSSGTTPSTGDESRLGLWIAMLAAGVLGLACVTVVTVSRKKRSGK